MSGDPMADPIGLAPTEAKQWFAIVDTHDSSVIGRILVIAGRVAAHSWGCSYIGLEWYLERGRYEGSEHWTVEELP